MHCRLPAWSWFLGWDWITCVEPVRSEVRVELWSRCPVRSRRACSSSESHRIGTQEMETATQTAFIAITVLCGGSGWRISSNKSVISVTWVFKGPMESPIGLFFKLQEIFTTAVIEQNQQIGSWFVFICENNMLPANQDKLIKVTQDSNHATPHLMRNSFEGLLIL